MRSRLLRDLRAVAGLLAWTAAQKRVAGLHAVAGTSPGRLGVGVHRAAGLARDVDPTMADRGRARLCDTARRRRPNLRVLAAGRQRGHERARRGERQDDVGDAVPRVVHDEQGRSASRAGTEIDAGLCGWQAVLDRHDRSDLRLRCEDGKGALAKAGLGAGADVHDARVLADCRSRAGDLSPGRPRQGRHHGVRRQHGRDEVELGWRWTGLRLADHRGSRRHAAAHRADAGEAGRPRRRRPARCCGSGRSSAAISRTRPRRSWPVRP